MDDEWSIRSDKNHIFISGPISRDMGVIFNNALIEITSKNIHIHITSSGGDVSATFGMIDRLNARKRMKKIREIKTYAEGYCHSAAVTLWLAGDSRYSTNNCTFCIHNSTVDNSEKHSQEIQRRCEERLCQYESKRTGLSFKKMKKIRDEGKHWTAEELSPLINKPIHIFDD